MMKPFYSIKCIIFTFLIIVGPGEAFGGLLGEAVYEGKIKLLSPPTNPSFAKSRRANWRRVSQLFGDLDGSLS